MRTNSLPDDLPEGQLDLGMVLTSTAFLVLFPAAPGCSQGHVLHGNKGETKRCSFRRHSDPSMLARITPLNRCATQQFHSAPICLFDSPRHELHKRIGGELPRE